MARRSITQKRTQKNHMVDQYLHVTMLNDMRTKNVINKKYNVRNHLTGHKDKLKKKKQLRLQ